MSEYADIIMEEMLKLSKAARVKGNVTDGISAMALAMNFAMSMAHTEEGGIERKLDDTLEDDGDEDDSLGGRVV